MEIADYPTQWEIMTVTAKRRAARKRREAAREIVLRALIADLPEGEFNRRVEAVIAVLEEGIE